MRPWPSASEAEIDDFSRLLRARKLHGLPSLKAVDFGATLLDRGRAPFVPSNPLIPGLKATESRERLSDRRPETLPRSDALLRRLTSFRPPPLALSGQSRPSGDVKPAQDADDVES